MEHLLEYVKQKEKLLYDINCIKKYIEGGDYDKSLKRAWIDYNNQLEEINQKLVEYVKPHYDQLYEKKIELTEEMKGYQEKINELKAQIKYLNDLMDQEKA